MRCFGRNSNGQLGNGTTSSSGSVSLVSGITDAIDVGVNPGNSDSMNRSCALLASGQVHCWGRNYSTYSYMGTGDTVSQYLLPTPVCQSGSTAAGTCVPLANVVQMSIDAAGGCAVTSTSPSSTTDNRVVCWGDTGNSSLNTSTVCTSGAHGTNNCVELTKVIKVDSNRNHRCAVTSDGEIYCWGSNSDGQLGREVTSSIMRQAAPMTDGGSPITDGIDVATGGESTCIIRRPVAPATKNRIQCVGDLYYGHLGDGVADQTTNSRRVTWRDICGHSRSVPSTSSCATTELPGSPTRLVGGTVSMCAYIADGYGTNDDGWSCWNGGPSGLYLYLGRPMSSSGSTVYGYIGQICTTSSTYSPSGECEPAKRFAASEVDMSGSTICGVASGSVYCWGMGGGGSIIGQNSWVYYPNLIPMGKSLRFAALPSGAEPNQSFSPRPRVQLVDEFGTDVATAGVVVTATMTALSGAGSLTGSTTATTDSSGEAVFSDLSISAVGTYVVSFSATNYGSLGQRLVVVQLQARTLALTTNFLSSYLFTATIPDVVATPSAGGGTIVYSTSTSNVCSVNPSTGSVSPISVGTCTVKANIASDGTYLDATTSDTSFSITRLARSLTIDPTSFTSSYTMPVTGPTLQANVSAGPGSITYASSTSSVCQVGASTGAVVFVGGGTCLITASVTASGDYEAAVSPAVSIAVTGAPVITTTVAPSNTAAPTASTPTATTVPGGNTGGATGAATATTEPASIASTTTVAPTTTTTLPEIEVPEVADNGAALVIDGERIEATVTRENNQLILQAGVIRARISAVKREGGRAPLDSEGRIRMNQGDSVEIEVTGFGAETRVEVRMYSDPVLLGRSTVSALGNLAASYEVPESVENGRHTVVLVGESAAGDDLTFALAVFVGDESSGPSALALLVGIPLGLAVIGALIIPAILRRRRDDPAGA